MRTEGRGLIHIHSSDRRRLDDRRRLHIAPRLCGFWSAGPPSFRYGQREGAGVVVGCRARGTEPAEKSASPEIESICPCCRLLQGLPHTLLLENANGEQFVLLSAATLPSRPALAAGLLPLPLITSNPHCGRSRAGPCPCTCRTSMQATTP